jgi:hypothetical protein
LWAAPFAGYAGTGMYWWWDNYIDPNNLWGEFRPVADFFAGEDLAGYQQGAPQPSGDSVRALSLQQPERALVWVINRDYTVVQSARAYNAAMLSKSFDPNADWFFEPPLVENVQVTLSGMADGRYSVRWYDPQSGAWLEEGVVDAQNGALVLALPAFHADLAAKITPLE